MVNNSGPASDRYTMEMYLAWVSPPITNIPLFTRMGPWQDFTTVTNCSIPINTTSLLLNAQGNPASEDELIGVNLMIALAIHMSRYDSTRDCFAEYEEVMGYVFLELVDYLRII